MKNSNKSAGWMMSKFFTRVFLPAAALLNFALYYKATDGDTGAGAFDDFSPAFSGWLNLLVAFVCLLYVVIRIRADLTE
ncbi:hypothetical protein [Pantoea coffeiphila]|uniref:Uncharacterized protein n=1 Tax=Pantoea coffeiphila TaxID=1465635 RepID=A0A2S9I708_9GAMM|nr:hypothetical protein [Pantoea coffeiphila]PRD13561.1 hypothetical protein CQW29_20060 [Pantoea coffeiphila]